MQLVNTVTTPLPNDSRRFHNAIAVHDDAGMDRPSLIAAVAPNNRLHKKRKQHPLGATAALLILCLLWYSSASAAIITSKTVLTHTLAPFTLSFTQFVLASGCALAVSWWRTGGLTPLHVPHAQRWSVFKVRALSLIHI